MNSLEAMQQTPVPNRRILISTAAGDGFVQVGVRDHGVGLPEEDSDKIFSHFFSTKPNGMGTGLTIVRRSWNPMVENWAPRMWRAAQGSSFACRQRRA